MHFCKIRISQNFLFSNQETHAESMCPKICIAFAALLCVNMCDACFRQVSKTRANSVIQIYKEQKREIYNVKLN